MNYTGTTNRSEFSYDGLNRCVKIVEKTDGVVNSTRKFVWNGTEKCEFRNANDGVTVRVYSQGQYSGGAASFYTRDHLGSIREMVDGSGNVVARYDYDSFGQSTTVIGTTKPDLNFTGLYRHAKSNLDLATYRAYDPDLGRWLSRDPIAETGGVNLYGYVSNNPSNAVDSLGLFEIPPPLPMTPAQRDLARAAFGPGGASVNINQGVLSGANLRDLGVLRHNAERGLSLANSANTAATQAARLSATNQAISGYWGPLAQLASAAAYSFALGGAPISTSFAIAPFGSTVALGAAGGAGWFAGRGFMQIPAPFGNGETLDQAWEDIFYNLFFNRCP